MPYTPLHASTPEDIAALVRDTIETTRAAQSGGSINEAAIAAEVATVLNALTGAPKRQAIEALTSVFVHAVLVSREASIFGPPIETATLHERIATRLCDPDRVRA